MRKNKNLQIAAKADLKEYENEQFKAALLSEHSKPEKSGGMRGNYRLAFCSLAAVLLIVAIVLPVALLGGYLEKNEVTYESSVEMVSAHLANANLNPDMVESVTLVCDKVSKDELYFIVKSKPLANDGNCEVRIYFNSAYKPKDFVASGKYFLNGEIVELTPMCQYDKEKDLVHHVVRAKAKKDGVLFHFTYDLYKERYQPSFPTTPGGFGESAEGSIESASIPEGWHYDSSNFTVGELFAYIDNLFE